MSVADIVDDDPFAAPIEPSAPEEGAQTADPEPAADPVPVVEPAIEAVPAVAETPIDEQEAAPADPEVVAPASTNAEGTGTVDPLDPLHDPEPAADVLSSAPPRLHVSLVDQLELRWSEVKDFVSRLEGETGVGELDTVLGVARHYLKV